MNSCTYKKDIFKKESVLLYFSQLSEILIKKINYSLILCYHIKWFEILPYTKAKSVPNVKRILGIISSGVPPFVMEVSSDIVMFLFNFIILRLAANIGVAAFGVITVISLVVVAMYTGLSQGIQPIISLNHGTKNISNVKAILKYAMATMLLLSGVIYTVIFFVASQLTFIFNSEKNEMLQQFAITGLKLYFLACPVATCQGFFHHLSIFSPLIQSLMMMRFSLSCALSILD